MVGWSKKRRRRCGGGVCHHGLSSVAISVCCYRVIYTVQCLVKMMKVTRMHPNTTAPWSRTIRSLHHQGGGVPHEPTSRTAISCQQAGIGPNGNFGPDRLSRLRLWNCETGFWLKHSNKDVYREHSGYGAPYGARCAWALPPLAFCPARKLW